MRAIIVRLDRIPANVAKTGQFLRKIGVTTIIRTPEAAASACVCID